MEFVFIVCVVHCGCGNAITIMIFMMQNLSPTTWQALSCELMVTVSVYTASVCVHCQHTLHNTQKPAHLKFKGHLLA